MNSKDFHLTGALGYYDTYIKTSFCGGSPSGWLNKDLKTGVYGKADTTQAFAGYFEGPVKVVGTLDATSLCPALIGVIKNALAGEEPLDLSGYFSKETGAEAPDSGLPPDPLWDPVPEGSMYMSAPLFWNEMASQPWAYKVGLTLALLADPSLTEYKVHNTTLWTESSLPSNLKNLRTSFKNLTTNQLPLRNEIIENGSIKSSLLAVPLSNYTVKSDLSNYATTLQLTVKADKSYVDTNFASTNNALSAKANAADVYTKVQVDSALSNKADTSALNAKANAADVYTRTAADLLLNAKADAATTYSKTDINSKLALKADTANIYSKAEVDSKLGLKANAADVYTKAAADTLLNAKANAADLGPLATAGYVTTAQVRDTTGNSIFNADGTLSAAKVGGTLTESQLPNTLLFTTSSISASQISGRLTDSQLPSTINSSRITLSSDQPLSSYVDYTYGRSGASVLLKAPAEAKGINPQTDNAYSLGASGARWSAIYAATTAIKTGDLNEKYLVEGSAEDGDVMMISGPATMKLCNQSNSTKVSGIFRGESSGFVMNDELANGKNIVLVGRYPVKVEATSSAVEPGDLLVSSSKPGYATKAPENPKPGTIIGKALEGLAQGETGKILVLVTLQ
jgi:hypothetical protein